MDVMGIPGGQEQKKIFEMIMIRRSPRLISAFKPSEREYYLEKIPRQPQDDILLANYNKAKVKSSKKKLEETNILPTEVSSCIFYYTAQIWDHDPRSFVSGYSNHQLYSCTSTPTVIQLKALGSECHQACFFFISIGGDRSGAVLYFWTPSST